MSQSQYFDTLVICYLSKELSEEDEVWFLELINSDQEKRERFEELCLVFKLTGADIEKSVEDIDVDHEWETIRKSLFSHLDSTDNLTEDTILDTDNINDRHVIGSLKKWVVFSTSIFVMLFLGIIWKLNDGSASQISNTFSTGTDSASVLTYEINTTDFVKHIDLSDGSKVKLYPKSWINFNEGMKGKSRTINLLGKATFTVAKDPTKPFIVHSSGISVTAIGTRFQVRAFESENDISVKLEEGKVVVNAKSGKANTRDDYYLNPGDEFVFSKLHLKGKLKKYLFDEKSIATKDKKKLSKPIENITIPFIDKSSNWFMFNNQSLPEVLEYLKEMYRVNIVYKKDQLANLYFIGAFKTNESIDVVLNKIAALNGLKVSQSDKGYYLSRIN